MPAGPPVVLQVEVLFSKLPLVPKETFKISSSAGLIAEEVPYPVGRFCGPPIKAVSVMESPAQTGSGLSVAEKAGVPLILYELKLVTGAAPAGNATVVPQKALGKLALEPKFGVLELS